MSSVTIRRGELFISRDGSGGVVWHGRPDVLDVKSASCIEGTDDVLVLLDVDRLKELKPDHPRVQSRDEADVQWTFPYHNLIRLACDGTLHWRAKLPYQHSADPSYPDGFDCFTAFHWIGGELIAFTWSCFRCRINIETGSLMDFVFTK